MLRIVLTEKNPKPPLQVPMTLCRLTELANAPQAGPEEKMVIQGNDSLGLGNDQAKPVTEEHLTASLCVSAHLHLLSFNSIYHGIVTVRKKSNRILVIIHDSSFQQSKPVEYSAQKEYS